ncbi:unnamed protein product [Hapterophycus canaliculatus]
MLCGIYRLLMEARVCHSLCMVRFSVCVVFAEEARRPGENTAKDDPAGCRGPFTPMVQKRCASWARHIALEKRCTSRGLFKPSVASCGGRSRVCRRKRDGVVRLLRRFRSLSVSRAFVHPPRVRRWPAEGL